MKSIKLYQARALIGHHNIDSLIYVDYDKVYFDFADYTSHDIFSQTVFKEADNNQLYTFFWDKDIYSHNIYVKKVHGSTIDINKYSTTDDNCLVRIYPVTAEKATITKYIRDDSNEDY